MTRTDYHYDQFYAPTSPVGAVRATRIPYLLPGNPWERAEQVDPSRNTVVDPDHETEGAQLLLAYYEAVRRARRVRWGASATALTLGAIATVIGGLLGEPVLSLVGLSLGAFIAFQILVGRITLSSKTVTAKSTLKSSGFFRDRTLLNGYLITTLNQAVIWEAIDIEQRRREIDYNAVRLRSHVHLPPHRETEIAQLQDQEQELRKRLVDMLDPQHPDRAHLSDELREKFGSRTPLGQLSVESTDRLWSSEDPQQR